MGNRMEVRKSQRNLNKMVVLISNLPRQIAYFLEEKLSKIYHILFNLRGKSLAQTR